MFGKVGNFAYIMPAEMLCSLLQSTAPYLTHSKEKSILQKLPTKEISWQYQILSITIRPTNKNLNNSLQHQSIEV